MDESSTRNVFVSRPQQQQQQSIFSRSTIYKRHEARLTRSESLLDDPRPTPVRMLSRLPGFRSFFLPYNPRIHGSKRQQRQTNIAVATSQHSTMSTFHHHDAPPTGMDATMIAHSFQSFVAATISSGVAYALLGTPPSAAVSPFLPSTPTTTFLSYTTPPHMVRVQQQAAAGVNVTTPSPTRSFFLSSSSSAALTSVQHYGVALTTLRLVVHDTVTQTTESPLLASIAAGLATSSCWSLWWRRQQQPLSSVLRSVPTAAVATARSPLVAPMVAQEIATTILYCGLWEYGHDNDDSLPQLIASGGLAGYLVHRTLRAVPLHALVFVGYNALRPTCNMQHTAGRTHNH